MPIAAALLKRWTLLPETTPTAPARTRGCVFYPLPDAAKAMRLIALLSRLRPSLAACLVLVASASFIPLPATSQPVPPEPAPIPVPPEPEPTPSPTATEDLVVITGPTEANPGGYFIVSVKTPIPGDDVLVEVSPVAPDGASPPIELLGKQPGELVYLYQQVVGGKYVFRASAQVSVDKSEGFDPHDEDELIVTVKAPGPVPPGPNPPGPEPDPEPEPTPDTVGPIFGVLLYDTESGDTISREQLLTLNSSAFDEYLKAKGLKANGSVQFRVWDDDKITEASIAEESELLRKAYAEAKAKYRGRAYLVLSNGKTGYSGELPETEAGIFETFKKYGG